MQNKVHYSSQSNEWETPQALFDEYNAVYNFTLDPCSTHENAKCKKHFTIKEDGLKQSWAGETVFMNPPYGIELKRWIKKAYEESLQGGVIVCLIPARPDTSYWHDWIFKKAEIKWLRGRLKFSNSKNSAPFPSAVVIYNYKQELEKQNMDNNKWVLIRKSDGWEWRNDFLLIKREVMDDSDPNEIIYCYNLYRILNDGDIKILNQTQNVLKLSHVWQFPDLPTAKRVGNILLLT